MHERQRVSDPLRKKATGRPGALRQTGPLSNLSNLVYFLIFPSNPFPLLGPRLSRTSTLSVFAALNPV